MSDSKLLLSLIVGLFLGMIFSNCYFSGKIYSECEAQHLTTFGNYKYICVYVGNADQHKAYSESHGDGSHDGSQADVEVTGVHITGMHVTQ